MKRLTLFFLVSFLALALTSEGAKVPLSSSSQSGGSSGEIPYAPGRLLVKFKADAAKAVSAGAFDKRGSRFVTATGTSSLDNLLASVQTQAIKPLFKEHHEGIYIQRLTPQALHNQIKAKFPVRSQRIPQGTAIQPLEDYFIVELGPGVDPIQAAVSFRGDPSVEYAIPDYIATEEFVPNDHHYNVLGDAANPGGWEQPYDDMWALKKINPEEAWDIAPARGGGVVVAVVDTGLDYNHEDISDENIPATNVYQNTAGGVSGWGEDADQDGRTLEFNGTQWVLDPGDLNGIDDDGNGYVDDLIGFDFVGDDSDPFDDRDTGHGTHVSGTIAAIGDNWIGIIGVSPNAKIMPLKTIDATGGGPTSGYIEAIYYAANNGAHVINNSWGFNFKLPNNPPLEEAIRYAHSLGCVVVFSAGNENDNVLYYTPKNMPEVMTVAASDRNDKKYGSSNYGSRIDVAAPGGGPFETPPAADPQANILSLKASAVPNGTSTIVSANYLRKKGTSMAAPHVSGLAALILSDRPTLTNEEVRHLIRSTADDFGVPLGNGVNRFDIFTGYGRIDATGALQVPTTTKAVATITYPRYQNVTGTIQVTGTATGNPSPVVYQLTHSEGSHPDESAPSWEVLLLGSGPVVDGNLHTWDISGLAKGEHTLSLSVGTAGGFAARDDVLFNVPWPFKSGWIVSSSAAVADLEGDGSLEILIGSTDGKLYCLNIDGTERWFYPTAGAIASSPAVADLDGDGSFEILFGSKDHGFYCLNADGTLRWSFSASDRIFSSPTVADIDNNGSGLEILFGTYDDSTFPDTDPMDNMLYCLNADGTLRWSFSASDRILSSPAVADLENNGSTLEILFGSHDRNLYCLNATGSPCTTWSQPFAASGSIQSSPAVADLDGDGTPEILFGSHDRNLYCLNATGLPCTTWSQPFATGDYIISSPAVADLDGDGSPEILFGSNDRNLYCLDATGSLCTTWSQPFLASDGITSSPAVGDLDNDGTLEILFGDRDNNLYCLRPDGVQRWLFTPPVIENVNLEIHSSPSLADLDGNGTLEILFGSNDERVYALNSSGNLFTPPATPSPTFRAPWPMFRHDPRHTGNYPNVVDNLAPIFTKPLGSASSVVVSSAYSLLFEAVDTTGETMTLTVVTNTASSWLNCGSIPPAANPVSRTCSGTSPSTTGTYTLTLRATDNGSPVLYTDKTVTITVKKSDGGGGGGGCFLAGTPILLPNGTTKPIENLKVGDYVLAFDEKSKSLRKDKVKAFFEHEADHYLILNDTLQVTENHPVYSEGDWIEIGKLKVGDNLLNSKGQPETITSIQKVKQNVKVYNLEVNPYHTYIAGGIVVHNKAPRKLRFGM